VARFRGHRNTAKELRSEQTRTDHLKITALPNPSRNYFTLKIQSTAKELLQVRVLDVSGKIVESRNGLGANTTFHIGNNFHAGIYLIEITQGKQQQILKLVKQ
jgi:hypothetical protein